MARPIRRFDPNNPGHRRLRRLERLAWLLGGAVPMGRFRVGLDPIIGPMPGVGDSIDALLSLYEMCEKQPKGVRCGC